MRKKTRVIKFSRASYLEVVVLVLGMLVLAGWRVTHGSSRLAEGVTVEAIRAVQNGMTEENVVAILCEPLERAPSASYPDAIMLTYLEPAYFASKAILEK